jgi:hypothetical protein
MLMQVKIADERTLYEKLDFVPQLRLIFLPA